MAFTSKKANSKNDTDVFQSQETLALETESTPAVARYLSTLKFKRTPFGGVDEADVWKKLETLCQIYEDAIYTERVQKNKLEQAMALIRARAAAAKQRPREEG